MGGGSRRTHLGEAEEEAHAAQDLQGFRSMSQHLVTAGVTVTVLFTGLQPNTGWTRV